MKKQTATLFGTSLDKDDFATTRKVLSQNCTYIIGTETLTGPEDISNSYKSNMIEGRKKLDVLEWGKCRIEEISNNEFYVHFTDYLVHKEKEYTHRCKQKVTVGPNDLIVSIEHIDDPDEQNRLNEYYKSVGLK